MTVDSDTEGREGTTGVIDALGDVHRDADKQGDGEHGHVFHLPIVSLTAQPSLPPQLPPTMVMRYLEGPGPQAEALHQ